MLVKDSLNPLTAKRQASLKHRYATISNNQLADLARAHMIRAIVENIRNTSVDKSDIALVESLGLPLDDDVQAHDAIMRGYDRASKQAQSALENLY